MVNKFKYIIEIFKTIYDLGNLEPNISYGINNTSSIQIENLSNNFFDSTENELNIEEIVFDTWNKKSIPFIFSSTKKEAIFKKENGNLIINYDIVASSFLFLSGWLDANNDNKDELGRVCFNKTLQCKLGITQIPIVNYYFDILKTAIEDVYNVKIYPKYIQYPFITSVSHDIDKCNTGWKEEVFYLLKKLRILPIFKISILKLLSKDIWFNLKEIIDYERLNNINSVFYFLTKKGGFKKRIYNADYSIDQPSLKHIFNKILKNESEIGIHGSFGTSDSLKLFNAEILKIENIINHKIIGNRFHYLQFNFKNTPEILEKSNIKYDMSLGFAEHIGFRNGICHPFKLYNFKEDKPYDYFEIPLVLMDVTLFNKNYMNLSFDEAFEQSKNLISEISKFNGIFTVLWHNNSYSPYKYGYRKEFIERLLDYCKINNTVFKTPKQIFSI